MASERRPRLALALVLALSAAGATTGAARTARAEPTAADKETARSLMDQGQDKRDKNDLRGALKDFQAADAIMHVPTTGLEVAKTEVLLNQLVEARDVALTVSRIPERAGGDPAPFVDARNKARALADDLESRIPSIVVQLHGAPDASSPAVTIDGVTIPAAAVGVPRKLNPGSHKIVARAGDLEGHADVSVAERESKTVTVDLAPPAPAASAPTPATPPEGGSVDDGGSSSGHGKSYTLAFVGFGVGVVGIAVGSITGAMSLSKTSTLKDQCPNDACPDATWNSSSFQDDKSSAQTLGTVSTIAFIAGGAGIAVGVVGLLLAKGATADASATTTGAHVTPWIGVGSAGLSGRF